MHDRVVSILLPFSINVRFRWLLSVSFKDDIIFYAKLIERSERALQKRHWDEQDRWFYNRVDGEPGLLKMRGLYDTFPLFAGIATEAQAQHLLAAVLDPEQYWTPYGVTAVAQNDPNYRDNGYWNGSVWIAPQWFFWKTFYNLGEMAAARQLTDNVLGLWERNHRETLCCWEEFRIKTGRGAGNSRFAGLSTPILALRRARRSSGRIQTGQDVLITAKADPRCGLFDAELVAPFASGRTGVSVVLESHGCYEITVDGTSCGEITADKWGYLAFPVDYSQGQTVKVAVRKKG